LSVVLIVIGYSTAFFPVLQRAGGWVMAAGVTLSTVAALTLGALKGQSARAQSRLVIAALLGTATALGAGFAIALSNSSIDGSIALLWGLPRPTALLLAIVGLVPLFVLPLVYAATFRSHVLTDEDLARIAEVSARLRRDDTGP
jgi:hypothetical protein